MKLCESKPPKPQRTFTTNLWRRKTFIQLILPRLKVLLELSFKASKNFKTYDPLKVHQIQALKLRKTSTTNLRRLRKFEEPTKNMTREAQEISNEHIARDSSQFHSKDLSIHFPIQVEDILCTSLDYIDAILELKTFLRRSN